MRSCAHAAWLTAAGMREERTPRRPCPEGWQRHVYTVGDGPAAKKNGIFPFVTTWMDLEGIVPSERCQRKTNAVWSHSRVGSNKT